MGGVEGKLSFVILQLKFVTSPIAKKVSGVRYVYDGTSATIKIPFYFKSQTKCEPCLKRSHKRPIRHCKEKNRKSKTNFLTGRFHQSTEFVIRALLCEPFVIAFGEILITVYYSFKIFPLLWLAKSTRIIHHNQVLMTKLGRILRLMNRWRQKCSFFAG